MTLTAFFPATDCGCGMEETVSEIPERLERSLESLRIAEERATAGQLALEVMHEIRNPIEALGHLIYLTTHDAHNPEKVAEYMRMAEHEIAQVSRIANETLSFARSTRSPRPVDLVALAEAGLRIHQRKIESKQVHLVKDFPEDLIAPVYTGQMLQVVSNLITNALDALSPKGILYLRLRKRRGEVQFLIADNGHGIPQQYSESIFQPFFTTKEEAGTGLGLTLSKKIVEQHKGKISMRSSVRPGKTGTTFKISLPA